MSWEQEQQVDYSAGSMAMLPVAAGPTGLLMRVQRAQRAHPRVAVLPYFLNLDFPTRQVVVEPGSARPNRQIAVVQDFACPTRQVVEEQDFVRPNLRPVAAEPGSAPSQEFVVEEQDFVRPIPELAVEHGFAHPSLLVAAEHPMGWVVALVALVAPRDLRQA